MEDANRIVRKGEKGITIFAPCKYRIGKDARSEAHPPPLASPNRDNDKSKKMQLRGFRIVHVFDISQTEGEPIEDVEALRPKLLDDDAPEGIWDTLVALAKARYARTMINHAQRDPHLSEAEADLLRVVIFLLLMPFSLIYVVASWIIRRRKLITRMRHK